MNAHLSEKIGGRHATFSDDHKQNMSGDLNLVVNADIQAMFKSRTQSSSMLRKGTGPENPRFPLSMKSFSMGAFLISYPTNDQALGKRKTSI
jgi:hypothetical protein